MQILGFYLKRKSANRELLLMLFGGIQTYLNIYISEYENGKEI